MFSVMGYLAVELGEIFGFLSQNSTVQLLTGLVLLAFAYYSWKQALPAVLTNLSNLISKKSMGTSRDKSISPAGALMVGVLSTLIASPCSTPVLGGVLALVAQQETQIEGVLLMGVYGLGMSTLFLILGMGLVRVQALPRSGKWLTAVHNVSILLLALGGFYFIYQGVNHWL